MALPITIGGNGTFFIGEDKTLHLQVIDITGMEGKSNLWPTAPAVDITGWSIAFDLRLAVTSPDPPILGLTAVAPGTLPLASIIGTYNVVQALNTQRAEIVLNDDQTNLVKAQTYQCTWKRMDESSETVLAWGPCMPQKATAP